jgi:ribose-phosphate pyrophosphokinase
MIDMLKVFSGSSNRAFAEEVTEHLGLRLGKLDISRFSNDNLSIQIQENVRERDVFVVQSLSEPVSEHIMELFIILDALRSASAKRITAVIPYYSYARSDKKDAPRISITGRLLADLIRTAGADRVLTMDLHSDQVHGFFTVPVDHLTAIPILAEHARKTIDLSNSVAVATDAGAGKRVGKFAERLGIPMAIIDKRRIGDQEVKHGLVIGEVTGRDAIIFDDEISAASTIVSTAETLRKAGVKRLFAGATHPVLCGPAIERLKALEIEAILVANTVNVPEPKRLSKIHVLSVARLFAEAITRIHTGESIGALFS